LTIIIIYVYIIVLLQLPWYKLEEQTMKIRTLVAPIVSGLLQAVIVVALITLVNAVGSWLGQFLATAYGPQGNSLIATAILWLFIVSIVAVAIKSRRTSPPSQQ
jgi:hypothetical protein